MKRHAEVAREALRQLGGRASDAAIREAFMDALDPEEARLTTNAALDRYVKGLLRTSKTTGLPFAYSLNGQVVMRPMLMLEERVEVIVGLNRLARRASSRAKALAAETAEVFGLTPAEVDALVAEAS